MVFYQVFVIRFQIRGFKSSMSWWKRSPWSFKYAPLFPLKLSRCAPKIWTLRAANFAIVLHLCLNTLHIVLGLVIPQETPNQRCLTLLFPSWSASGEIQCNLCSSLFVAGQRRQIRILKSHEGCRLVIGSCDKLFHKAHIKSVVEERIYPGRPTVGRIWCCYHLHWLVPLLIVCRSIPAVPNAVIKQERGKCDFETHQEGQFYSPISSQTSYVRACRIIRILLLLFLLHRVIQGKRWVQVPVMK